MVRRSPDPELAEATVRSGTLCLARSSDAPFGDIYMTQKRRPTGKRSATVIGAGPNGLAAGVVLARAGVQVDLYEQSNYAGGGAQTRALIRPDFLNDTCSAVHPMALASPFFRAFGLEERISFATPDISYAQAIEPGKSAFAYRDLARTADELGAGGRAWQQFFGPLVRNSEQLKQLALGSPVAAAREPCTALRLGSRAFRLALPRFWRFGDGRADALFSGVAAHSLQPVGSLAASSVGLVLATLAHNTGWPVPIGGSQRITDALVADFVAHGGVLHKGVLIDSLSDVDAEAVIFDTSVQALHRIARDRLARRDLRRTGRRRLSPAIVKVDFALSGPVPWTDPELRQAVTVHLGGTRQNMRTFGAEIQQEKDTPTPFVLLTQPSVIDTSRAPGAAQVLWAYAMVNRTSATAAAERITGRISEFAPGFTNLVLGTTVTTPSDLERHNPNYIGGDIFSGATDLRGLLCRPQFATHPWRTTSRGIYLCSSAAAPGPGVHGMGGLNAARLALRDIFGVEHLPKLGPEC